MGVYGGPDISNDGLVLCYDFSSKKSYSGTGTTVYDISGNNNNGTLQVSPTYSSDENGKLVFVSGSTQHITYPSISFDNTPFTLEFVGNMISPIDSSNRRGIFSRLGTVVGELSSPNVYFLNSLISGSSTNTNIYLRSMVTDQIGHWIFTYNSSQEAFNAVNGIVLGTPDTQYQAYGDVEFIFSSFGESNYGRYYVGDLFFMRIYNREFTGEEMIANYNAIKYRFDI